MAALPAGVIDLKTERKLTQGQPVYVRSVKQAWIPAVVVDHTEKNLTVTVQYDDYTVETKKTQDVVLRSEEMDFLTCLSLTDLNPINEATVLDCLEERYTHDIYYTSAGTTIVAVNPFKDVPQLYHIHTIYDYHNSHQTKDPHIYIIAEKAYTQMVREQGKVNQSIIVSGESGAGKTVSAKHLLRYLTIISSPENEINLERSIPGSVIEQQVLDSNPILEAFGNAATPRNGNSSRFGKFIQLQFHRNGHIVGGLIQTYLLEKTRVVHQGSAENNFHIFYQLLSLKNLQAIPQWLEEVRSEVMNSGLNCIIAQQADSLTILQTVDAMTNIGVLPNNQVSMFKILLAILHLSNLRFKSARDGEASSLSDDEAFNKAYIVSQTCKDECARLLGISSLDLHQALLNRNISSGPRSRLSVVVKPVTVSEAQSRRDSLSMLLYARLFDWLVCFINHQIKSSSFHHVINLLDIYGFETFELNSLEQLCINYANERLQQHYIVHFLRDLQAEYEAENIPWTSVAYKDNKVCVETLDGPTGVFGVLNEEVVLNRPSDDCSLCGRIIKAGSSHGVVWKPGAGTYETKFLVRHYAGDVLYTVQDAVKKNKDNIPAELILLMETSSNSFILNLFSEDQFSHTEQSLTPTKTKKKISVLTKFKSSLDSLMTSLNSSNAHFIRCIKPNTSNKADHFDRPYALQQLRACGTLETVDICHLGYPARMTYQDFVQRYGFLVKLAGSVPGLYRQHCDRNFSNQAEGEDKENIDTLSDKVDAKFVHVEHLHHTPRKRLRRSGTYTEHPHRMCALVLMSVYPKQDLRDCHLQFGKNKIFLTNKQMDHLEHTRASALSFLMAKAQALWRCYLQRKMYLQLRFATVKIQAIWRTHLEVIRLKLVKSAVVKIQTVWRTHREVNKLRQVISAVVKIQSVWRTHREVNKLRQVKSAVVKIQTVWRTHMQVKRFRVLKQSVRTIEKAWRVYRLHKAVRSVANSSCIIKRSLRKWVNKRRLIKTQQGHELSDLVKMEVTSENLSWTPGLDFNGQHEDVLPESGDMTDNRRQVLSDEEVQDDESICSDDSGVIKDDFQSLSGDPLVEVPSKKLRVQLRADLRMGDGIITCRQLTRPGFKFITRRSVLQYGHYAHHYQLPHGLPDVFTDLTGLDCPCTTYPKVPLDLTAH
ncbi:unconventional myosin-XIX-like isoform X3 [Physella acuta]|nr:unconventional myosin-XIX-like isoform X3 [Physella acuta]XP_059168017.1 unconventional myosin-XIX-like isoform X3 [Physella acuta]